MNESNLNNRLNSVRDTENEKKLKRYALEDPSPQVREIAVSKISNPIILSHIIKYDESLNVVKQAVKSLDDECELKDIVIHLIKRPMLANQEIIREIIGKITNMSYLMEIAINDFTDVIMDRVHEINPKILMIIRVKSKTFAPTIVTTQSILADIVMSDDRKWWGRDSAFSRITDQDELIRIAYEDSDWRFKSRALKKITNQDVLIDFAFNSDNEDLRISAIKGITDQNALKELALNSDDEKTCTEAVKHITNQNILKEISLTGNKKLYETITRITLDESTKTFTVFEGTRDYYLRQEAAMRITDKDLLTEIALNDPSLKIHYVDTENITNQDVLIEIALNEDNQGIVQDATSKLDEETAILLNSLKKVR